jgi:hypothetical protein
MRKESISINISGLFDVSISYLYQYWGWIYHDLINQIIRDISYVCSEEGSSIFHSTYPQQSVSDLLNIVFK